MASELKSMQKAGTCSINVFSARFEMQPFGVAAMAPAPVAESGGESSSSSSFDVTVRTYFPETWIWQLAQVGLVKHVFIS